MAGAPSGFGEYMTRKYDIQQQDASARSNMLNTQASLMPGQMASENALRGAQARETQERASTLGPLAQASIAGTQAGIGETMARSGLYGAQAAVTGLGMAPFGYDAARGIVNGLRGRTGGFNADVPSGGSDTGVTAPIAPSSDNGQIEWATVPGRAKGITRVPGKAKGKTAPAPAPAGPASPQAGLMGALPSLMGMMGGGTPTPNPMAAGNAPMGGFAVGGPVMGKGSGKVDTVPAMLAPGEAVLNKHAAELIGRDKIAAANAKGRLAMGMTPTNGRDLGGTPKPAKGNHLAGGTEQITGMPAPGQTQTGGSWGGQNQGLRAQLGFSRPAPAPTPVPKPPGYAKGTAKVKTPDFFKGYARGATEVHATIKTLGRGFAASNGLANGRRAL